MAEKKPEPGAIAVDEWIRTRDTRMRWRRQTGGNDRKRGVEPGRELKTKNEKPGPGTKIGDQERGIGPGDQNRRPRTRNRGRKEEPESTRTTIKFLPKVK